MKKFFERSKNLMFIIISMIISLILAFLLGMKFLYPLSLLAIIVLGLFQDNGKKDWQAVIATLLGALIIQLFLLI